MSDKKELLFAEIEKIREKKEKYLRWNFVPYFLMYFISILMVALIDLVIADFEPERLISGDFWYNILSTMFANLLVLVATIFIYHDTWAETDPRVIENQNKLRYIIMEGIDVDIKDFLNEQNYQKKKKAWIKHVNQKIMKLEKKHKQTKRIQRKIAQLETMKTDEYISKYIDAIKVKYDHISFVHLIAGFKYSNENDKTFESNFRLIAKDVWPRYLFSLAIPIIFSTVTFEEKNTITIFLIAKIIAKIISLIMNYLNGKRCAKKVLEMGTIYNLDRRIKKYEEYFAWKLERKKKVGDSTENHNMQNQHQDWSDDNRETNKGNGAERTREFIDKTLISI